MDTSAGMLPESRTEAGAAGLAAIIAEPARAVIATDYDGTLAPIVERPEQAVVAPGALAALAALASKVGEVAIITGRPVRDVLRLSGISRQVGHGGFGRLVILGQYGLERWDARTDRIGRSAHRQHDRARRRFHASYVRLRYQDCKTSIEPASRSSRAGHD